MTPAGGAFTSPGAISFWARACSALSDLLMVAPPHHLLLIFNVHTQAVSVCAWDAGALSDLLVRKFPNAPAVGLRVRVSGPCIGWRWSC